MLDITLTMSILHSTREVFMIKDLLAAVGEDTLSIAHGSSHLADCRGDTIIVVFQLSEHSFFEYRKSLLTLVVRLVLAGKCVPTLQKALFTLLHVLFACDYCVCTLFQISLCNSKALLGIVDFSATKVEFFLALANVADHLLSSVAAHDFAVVGDGWFSNCAGVIVCIAVYG